jgi:hypothetical protein
MHFARTVRDASSLSEFVHVVAPGLLPLTTEAYDGIDHFIVASNRLSRDSAGTQALRQWLQRGGTVWVMLDLVEPEGIAPLLGGALGFQVVDRVGLTTTRIEAPHTGRTASKPFVQQHERQVDLVRVLLPPEEQAPHTIEGWPAWFTRPVGRGKVIFTTLGAPAWYRPRGARDPRSPYATYPSLPMPTPPLEALARELHSPVPEEPFPSEAFQPLLQADIGYSIISRQAVILVLGGFLLGALLLGIGVRQSRRPELAGWLAPLMALAAAAVFVLLGEESRRAAPPTVAVAQIVEADTGTEEASAHGLLAVYRPDSGPAMVGADQGGLFQLDTTALEGQLRRLISTDLDAWHWENLELPAGVRSAPFHASIPTGGPITAVATLGPEGIEGKLAAGAFQDVGDALLSTSNGRQLAVHLQPDGAFRVSSADVLSVNQFLAGAVLSDQQQRRQEIYRAFLKRPIAGRPERGSTLLAWAKPIDMHFTLAPDARLVGSALLVLPLRLERPAGGSRVTIPGALLPYRQIIETGPIRPMLDSTKRADMHLRFQLPAAALPLQVERAWLVTKINAPSRSVVISGHTDGGLEEIHRVASPLDAIRVEINEGRFLQLDEQGGLHVSLSVSDMVHEEDTNQGRIQPVEKWTIEYLELEVAGRIP